jgi:purine nucleosidase
VTWRPAYVQVETVSPVTRGVAVADLLTSAEPPEPNCRVATDVDVDRFIELFVARIASI